MRTGPTSNGLVFTNDVDVARTVQQSLSRTAGLLAETIKASASEAGRYHAQLAAARFVVVDIAGEADPVTPFRALVDVLPPSTPVIAIGEVNDIRLYRRLLEAGAAEYFFRPLVSDLIATTLNRLAAGGKPLASAREGKAIHFIGVRGGSGVTSVAIRAAQLLSENPPRPVFLMDLNLRSSDMAMQLDLQPSGAVYGALGEADRIDDLFLERTLTKVSANLDLMSTLDPLEQPVRISEDALLTLFGKLASRYRYLVSEMPVSAISGLGKFLRIGSIVVLVSDGRMSSARDLARWRALISNSPSAPSIVHILNKSNTPDALPEDQFIRIAGAEPGIVIPYDAGFARASLMGMMREEGLEFLDEALQPLVSMISGTQGVRRAPAASFLRKLLRR